MYHLRYNKKLVKEVLDMRQTELKNEHTVAMGGKTKLHTTKKGKK